MDNHNGAVKQLETEGRQAITLYESNSGVIFWITPINLPTLYAIRLKSEDLFPYPDKRPYQHEEENSFSPGQLSPAEDNPDYLAACAEVDKERKQWLDRAIFTYCVTCPKYPTKELMIEAFRTQLNRLREIAVIDMDDYDTVLFHIVLSWNQPARDMETNALKVVDNEYGRIIQLCIQTVALTPGEVSAGVRFFLPQIRRG